MKSTSTDPDSNPSFPAAGVAGRDPRFHNEAAAAAYVGEVFRNNPCPYCGSEDSTLRADGISRRCAVCRRDASLRTGTPFARSHLPLRLWLRAVYLFSGRAETPSSSSLAGELGIRQASAWSMLRRLREADAALIRRLAEGFEKKKSSMAMTRQELAEEIRDGIRTGSLCRSGKLLPEREIATRFGTGRGLVREAIIVLETLGFIEVKGKEGVFVRTFSGEDCNRSLDVYSGWPAEMLPHAFQVRLVLESEAAGLAAVHRADEDLRRMAICIDSLVHVFRERPDDWNVQGGALNDLFHRLVIEAAHNPVLLRIHEGLQRIIRNTHSAFGAESMITPLEHWEERVIRSHRDIAESIRAGNEKVARARMRSHLEIAFAKLDALYRERIGGVLGTM